MITFSAVIGAGGHTVLAVLLLGAKVVAWDLEALREVRQWGLLAKEITCSPVISACGLTATITYSAVVGAYRKAGMRRTFSSLGEATARTPAGCGSYTAAVSACPALFHRPRSYARGLQGESMAERALQLLE